MESEEILRSRRLLRLKGYEEEDEEPERDEVERGNRALVLYDQKKHAVHEELDRLEKRALQLLIEKLEKTG